MKKKHLLQLCIGILISAAALWYVFHGIPIQEFFGAFKTFKYIWLLPALAVFYFGIWLRGLRWRWLFRPNYDVPLRYTVGGIFICFAFNSIFPARAGEFARAYLVGKRGKTGFSTAFATVVSERLLDGITILVLFVAAFFGAQKSLIAPDQVNEVTVLGKTITFKGVQIMASVKTMVMLCMILIAGIVAVSIPTTRGWMLKILHVFKFIPATFRNKIEALIHRFAEGLSALKDPKRLFGLGILSLIIWLTNAWSMMLIAWGFGLEISPAQSLALLFIASVFVSMSPTPGYWGFFEAGMVIGVSLLLGIDAKDPRLVSYAIFTHLTQWIPIVLIGLPWAWASHVSVGEAETAEAEAEQNI
ncbi:TPA: hypothetical protein DDW35_07170 [Candidatus Sumerlaeota bacterium]|jgi:glycosyltransferase 2 family protein|nr:hypothetical protein [Candidatus Sumerlaeota bacterium]